MPTLGHIQETIDRRHYERGGGDGLLPPVPLQCPICGAAAVDQFRLSIHLGDAHPLSAPRLILDGAIVVGEYSLHRRLDVAKIDVANATSVYVGEDGRPPREWSRDELDEALSSRGRGILDLELRNERAVDDASASERVRLRIRIPDVGDLEGVDEAFQLLGAEELDECVADSFVDRTRRFGTADAYASALHEYAVGVLVKDRAPGTSDAIPFEGFRDKYQRALHVLRNFPERPTARAVAGFLRFNLNDFGGSPPAAGVPALDRCADRLFELARGGTVRTTGAENRALSGRCPTDSATVFILERWRETGEAKARDVVDELLEFAGAGSTTPADAVKCRALVVDVATRVGFDARSIAAARALTSDIVFGAWATELVHAADGS